MKFVRAILAAVILAALAFSAPAQATPVGSSLCSAATSTTATCSAPASVATNHVMIASVAETSGTSFLIYAPQGWRPIGGVTECASMEMALFYYAETSADTTASTYAFHTNANANFTVRITDFANLDWRNPIAAYGAAGAVGCTGTAPSVTPTASNQEFLVATASTVNFAPPAGYFLSLEQTEGANISHYHAISTTVGSSATGTIATSGAVAQTVILNDSGSGGIKFRGEGALSSTSTLTTSALTQSTDSLFLVTGTGGNSSQAPCTDANGTWTVVDSVNEQVNWSKSIQTFSGTVAASHGVTCSSNGLGKIFTLVNEGSVDVHNHNTCSAVGTCTSTALTTLNANDLITYAVQTPINTGNIVATAPLVDWTNLAGLGTDGFAFAGKDAAGTAPTATFADSGTGVWGIVSVAFSPSVAPTVVSQTYPAVNNATTCDTGAGATSMVCSKPTGSTNDLLLAGEYITGNPGSGAVSLSGGFSLLQYSTDSAFNIAGPATGSDTGVLMLGLLQQMAVTTSTVAASGTTAYTLEGWAQPAWGWQQGGGLIGLNANQNGTSDTWDRQLKLDNGCHWMFRTAGTVIKSTHSYCDGKWHYIVGTYDGTNMRLYVDAVLDAGPTANATAETVTGYWVMDYVKAGTDGGTYYGGPFAENDIAVYEGTALSQARISAHYAAVGSGYHAAVTTDTPTHFWYLNDLHSDASIADHGSSSDPGIYLQFLGELNRGSLTGNSGNAPWFGGSFLNATGAYMSGQTEYTSTALTAYTEVVSFKMPSGYQGGGSILETDNANDGSGTSVGGALYIDSNNKLRLEGNCTVGVGTSFVSTGSYNDGAWHLGVVTWNGSVYTLYADSSTPLGTVSNANGPGNNFWWVVGSGNLNGASCTNNPGTPNSGAGGPNAGAFPGYIERVAVWDNVALNSTQVASLFTHWQDGTFDTTVAGLSPTSYWKMIETSTFTAADSAGSNTGLYGNFQGRAIAIFAKARTASEPLNYTFSLGNSQLAAGAIVDITGAKNTIDSIVASGASFKGTATGFTSAPYFLPANVADSGAIEIPVLGWTNGTIGTVSTPQFPFATAAQDNDASGVGFWIGSINYDTPSGSLGGFTNITQSVTNLFSMDMVLPGGTPVNLSAGGYAFILY